MNDREEWRERVRDIRATSATWWWWCPPGSSHVKVVYCRKKKSTPQGVSKIWHKAIWWWESSPVALRIVLWPDTANAPKSTLIGNICTKLYILNQSNRTVWSFKLCENKWRIEVWKFVWIYFLYKITKITILSYITVHMREILRTNMLNDTKASIFG